MGAQASRLHVKKPENAGGTPAFPAKPEGFAVLQSPLVIL